MEELYTGGGALLWWRSSTLVDSARAVKYLVESVRLLLVHFVSFICVTETVILHCCCCSYLFSLEVIVVITRFSSSP